MEFINLPLELREKIFSFSTNNSPSTYYILTQYFPSFRIGNKKLFKKGHIVIDAIKYDNVDLIKWLYNSNLSFWETDVVNHSIQYRSFKIFEWTEKQKFPWNENTCKAAVEIGDLNLVKYLRENGCDWNSESCSGCCREWIFRIFLYGLTRINVHYMT